MKKIIEWLKSVFFTRCQNCGSYDTEWNEGWGRVYCKECNKRVI